MIPRNIRYLPALLLALLALASPSLVVPARADITVTYVDLNSIGGACSDTRAASEVTVSTPWCTTARALIAAPEGATVLMRAGTYPSLKAVSIKRTQPLTFKPMSGESVSLSGKSGSVELTDRAVYMSASSNLRLEGVKITGGVYALNSSNLQFSGNELTVVGMRLRNVSDTLIEANNFHSFVGSTRALETTANVGESGAKRLTIRGNEIHATQYDALALYWRLEDVTVEDNYIHDVRRPEGSSLHTDALQIAPQSEGSWGAIIVRRNRILDYDQGLLVKDGTTRGLVLENNLIGAPRVFATHIYSAPNARITNNTIVSGSLYLRDKTTAAIVSNNVLQKFALDPTASVALTDHNLVDRSLYNPGYVPGPNDLNGRASFVNPAAYDYRLSESSLGVNTGSPANNAPLHDLLMKPRPSGDGFDMGAYEIQFPPPFRVSDSFTDTAGLLLSSHKSDTDQTWVRHTPSGTGTASITAANMIRRSGTGNAGYTVSATPDSAEYAVSATFTVRSSLSARLGLTARVSPTSASYYSVIHDQGLHTWQLMKTVNGVSTILGQYPERLPAGAVRTVKLEIKDASKKVFISNVERLSSTDNAISEPGMAGVYFSGKPVSDSTGAHLDNFTAENLLR